MGFELGPGFQRRPPRGWEPARVFATDWSVLPPAPDESGSTSPALLETSVRMAVTWELQVDGRAPVSFAEERNAPIWVSEQSVSGKRWYKPRLRPSYGLMRSIGLPCFVDPGDPTRLWIDWDAAYDEHEEAWERKGRIDREIARRNNAFDNVTNRIFNPLQGKLREGEEALVDAEIARRAARDERIRDDILQANREQMRAQGIEPVTAGDHATQGERIARLERLKKEGRKAGAVIVEHTETGRSLANMPVVQITLDVEEGGLTRRVTYEHIWGPRHLKAFPPGKQVTVRVDPNDPHLVELA